MTQQPKVSETLLDGQKPFAECEFGLDRRLTKAVAKMRFVHATLVQVHCIPLALQGKDLLVRARTGSGKTAAFALPLLHKILQHKQDAPASEPAVRALVLVPTKELVEQTRRHMMELMYYCQDTVSLLALGGQSMNAQQALLRDAPDVLVATPGRLVAHLEAGNLTLKDSVQTVVIDEADLVLSFGYGEDIRTIFNALPKACQTFCMSATLSPELEKLKRSVLHNPAVVKLEEGATDGKLQQFYLPVKPADKDLLLYALLRLGVVSGKVIFFVNSTDAAYRLKLFFEQFVIKSAVLNAKLPHNSRQHIIEEFNRGLFDYLIATDDSVDRDEVGDEDEDEEDEEEDGDEEEEDDDAEKSDAESEAVEEDVEEDKDSDEDSDKDEDSEKEGDEAMDSDDEETPGNEDDDDNEEQTKDKNTVGSKRGRADDEAYGVSRGVDFRGVQFVINVDFPKSVRAYTHRIGRTARGGASGTALSLVSMDDPKEERALKRVQAKQRAVRSESNDVLAQPAELAFDLKEIDCFRYRVEDVRRAVTRVAVREAQLADVKKEMLNSERLAAHFQANPRDLNMLEHDKVVGSAPVQAHLATIPDYLVPIELQPPAPARTKKKHNKRQRLADGKRRTDNDPLHTFEAPVADEDKKQTVEDRISYGNSGVGKSTAGRQKWKKQHRKGHFNPKTIAKKKFRMSKGATH
ncbi:ATP-dependent RNA helicase [Phytophthora fragariae]|uniref:RNA helicase n=1 Tax=Phytophthora fragariae TaxID=53985 RepID=A0A6A3UI92_9STRA|nr:ATP-dependent RNA helicase [Phytophthora fragariae]KAE8943739.1 ATP-dependent RNA helicase [Phytophthora fragariae]KAE9026874.1 ATP-dependent RNA helicase [Phytophthora fragariae]KAE9126290.1 ATP-dependent RNA helicase [Phytophthora fragariae]KAE9127200.1 ATP-dependent RNA helicase [Phytophthora fragariae]